MADKKIANFLKQLRKTSGYSANDVIDILKNYSIDISIKTLYGYESGLSMLNADVFVALCRIYKCDNPMDMFNTPSVNQFEIELIEKYRDLDSHGTEMVDMVLESEHKRWKSEQEKNESLTDNVISIKDKTQEHLEVNAAHALPNATEEDKQHDEDIMNDDSIWGK